jgi:hypothetical protein
VFAPKGPQAKRLLTEMYEIINKATQEVKDVVDSKNSSSMVINFHNGSMVYAVSANERTMSEGSHPNCFDGETTFINTNKGKKKLKDIVDNKLNINVRCYNEKTGVLEYKPITDWHKNSIQNKKMLKISYEIYGKIEEIICTEDHLVYTKNRGWVKALYLNLENDIVISPRALSTIDKNKKTSHKDYLNRGKKSKDTQIKRHQEGSLVVWSKGQTKETNASLKKISESLMGHKVSEKAIIQSRKWGKKWGGHNRGKSYKKIDRIFENINCLNCNDIITIKGTPNQIKWLKKNNKLRKYCKKCAGKIGAAKTAKTRQTNGSCEKITVIGFKNR